MNGLVAAQPAMNEAADRPESESNCDSGVASTFLAERLIREHGTALRRLVGRLTAWSPDAADLTQDVLAAALVALPKFRGECAMETWLTRIAIHRCRRWQRRRQLAMLWRRAAGATKPSTANSASDEVMRDEATEAVRAAVASLPPRYREVVVLRYLEERSAKETATALSVRVNTVDVRLHRARALLAAALAGLNDKE